MFFFAIRINLARLRSFILLLSLVFTSFIWLKECLTEAVSTGTTSKIFNSLMISGNMSAYPSQDSITILISCNVGGLESRFFFISAFFSLAKALLNTLRSDKISSLSTRGGEIYVFPPSCLSFLPIKIKQNLQFIVAKLRKSCFDCWE